MENSRGTGRHNPANQPVAIELLPNVKREFLLIVHPQQLFQLSGLVRVQLSDCDFDADRIE